MEIDIIKEAKNVFNIEIAELEKLKSKLGDDFQKLVRMILNLKNNNKVVVTGIGKSGIIGKKITATLASTGTTSVFINAAEALHGDLGMISDGDVVIAISNSGNSDEVLSILAPIKKIGGKIVAFTGNPDSMLGKYAELKDFTENDFAKYHPGGSLGKRLLLHVSDLMHIGDELPVVKEDEKIENVLMVLTKKKLGAVCISDTGFENGKLLGIITEGDIRRALEHKEKFFDYVASDIMISTPVTIEKDAMALDALHLMENRKSQINVLPVVENGNVVGLIRVHDLIGLR